MSTFPFVVRMPSQHPPTCSIFSNTLSLIIIRQIPFLVVSWGLVKIRSPTTLSSPRSLLHSLIMFSTSIIRQALASANAASPVAPLGLPRTSEGRITKIRKPRVSNRYAPSFFRPCVLASERLRHWVSPHAFSHHHHVISQIPLSAASILMEVMLSSLEPKT